MFSFFRMSRKAYSLRPEDGPLVESVPQKPSS